MMAYDPTQITTRVEAAAGPAEPSAPVVVPQPMMPVAAPVSNSSGNGNMDYKVQMLEQKVDRLVDSNLALADQITKLLKEKTALEEALRDKDLALTIARNQVMNITNTSKPQDQQIKDLQKRVAGLTEEKTAADKKIAELNQKMLLLKKKLARMVELLNKQTKAYE
jgi:chromosome segregation ATPase